MAEYYPYGEPNIKANPTAEDWAETQADINQVYRSYGIPDEEIPTAQSVTKNVAPEFAVAGVPAVGNTGLLGTLGSIAGVAGTLYGLWEALGGGEGGGLFNNNILGGDSVADVTVTESGNYIDSIPLSGPGLAEPPAAWIEKEWTTVQGGTKCQFYLVRMPTGRKRIAMYNFNTNGWKSWPIHKYSAAVIGKKLPSHKMLTRLRRNLKKHTADARTILKITSPTSLAKSRRRRR